MNDAEKDAIRRACTRTLSHTPLARRAPRRILEELLAATPGDLEGDNYGEGELVASFEREVATLLGKESAVFMPSGTMAQAIALRIWAERKRLPTVGFHPLSHLLLHEQSGYQWLHGLRAKLIGPRTSMMTLADLEREPEALAALLIELPQRELGGWLPSWEELVSMVTCARTRGAALHLDGARLWESQPFYGRPHAEIAGLFDSVYVSMYKGLGGIAGCVLAGPADFIREARVWQRRQGGNLVSMWPLILSARAGLAERLPRMPVYVEKARALAPRLAAIAGIEVMPCPPPTNMFHLFLEGDKERLIASALALAMSTKVWMFGRLGPTDTPSRHKLEVSCADASLELDDLEIVELFERLMAEAASAH